ncbi:MAG: hypothetical protein RIR11_33 [Bacteroidota bacterium]
MELKALLFSFNNVETPIMNHSSLLNSLELSKLPILNVLSQELLNQVVTKVKVHTFSKNSFIFKPGEKNNEVCLLLDGVIKNGIILPDGKELIQHIIKPLDFFGFGSLTGKSTRVHYAKTLSQYCTVLTIPCEIIGQLMRQSESFSKGIVEIVAKALFRSEKRLEVLLTADVRTRISFFLEDNLTRNNSPIPIETLLHEGLTQQDIATMIGATRQTVAMVLNEMRKDDKIEFNRKEIVVKSRQSIGSA